MTKHKGTFDDGRDKNASRSPIALAKQLPPPPPSFYCPLTLGIMTDPVQDKEGNSYEKVAIEKWLLENSTSPITRNRLRAKHLVPNRALKEAIDFEGIYDNVSSSCHATNPMANPEISRPVASSKHLIGHRQFINEVLISLNVQQLDRFGIALLPMKKILSTVDNQKINMVMVIEAQLTKDTFQLYTHFDAKRNFPIGRHGDSAANRVLMDLLQHGKHKALTLSKISKERMRFCFEGKNSDITSSKTKFMGILKMFVKVSFRMKKKIDMGVEELWAN
ncbi:hypothetical protein ACHAWF_006631 [Thalassiosira exigua]